ncbi:MAG: energy transducer TonB [Bacteroidetes bacterium]|nr:energy transducer TonB [Bacteroidota bacterium]
MKKLKKRKWNFEGNKLISFQIGMIAALLCVLYAFEYKSYDKYEVPKHERPIIEEPTIMVINTKHPPPPPPPKIEPHIIKVDFTNKVEEKGIEIDVAANQNTKVEPIEKPFVFKQEVIEVAPPVYIAEEQPTFPGGYSAMLKFLTDNVVYPELAKQINTTGTVYLQFVVEKDGSITDIKLLREIGSGCDEEAIRLIQLMPKWNCGKQNGRPVRVMMSIPIKFSLL